MVPSLANADDGAFPDPYDSEPDRNARPPAAVEAAGMFDLPEGFAVDLFAAEPDVRNPIAMCWDQRGRMWVAENFTYAESAKRFDLDLRDRILVFEDVDGDGRADGSKVFSDEMILLTSVEVGRGGVWALCPPRLLFIPDRDGDAVPDGEPEVKLDGFTVAKGNYHNFANGLRWGPDGWLYGRCGHSCPGRLGVPGTPDAGRVPIRGGIWRFHPDRGTVEVVAHGTTNPWGHDWDARGELFFINSVNGHLWHGIAGAHFVEGGTDPNPDVYERIDTHADHWHFDTTGKWQDSRDGKANALGGGHAHVGMMIYQADQWSEALRGRLFTLNLHGRRANVDRLERQGSGYVGRHQDDLFVTGDPWFRGIDIRQGPDGGAYVLDWSDTGECHEHSGVHRGSGRIYRLRRGNPAPPDLRDLASLTPDGVRRIIEMPNVWFERQLRDRLRESPAADSCVRVLREMIEGETDTVIRLRALWALDATGTVDTGLLRELLGDADEYLRVWAIRILTDEMAIDTLMGSRPAGESKPLSPALVVALVAMAASDDSALVRLTLASTLQRLPVPSRAALAEALVSHSEDVGDHNLPAMVWFGLIPLADADPMALVRVAGASRWPRIWRSGARSLAVRSARASAPLDALLSLGAKADPTLRTAMLEGMGAGFKGRGRVPRPAAWDAIVAANADTADPAVADLTRRIGALFDDGGALEMTRRLVVDPTADRAARLAGLESLIEARPPDLRQLCESLLDTPALRTRALGGLAGFDDPLLGRAVAARYDAFDPADRPAAIEMLVSRRPWAMALLARIREGAIPRGDLAAFHARQIRAFDDPTLNAELRDVWGEVRESPDEKRRLVDEWKAKLDPGALAESDLGHGRVVFRAVCGSCHVLYGEGGRIGPDLTGSGRADLGYLLENIADPGAVVGADFHMATLTLRDGRVVTGILGAENEHTLTLRQIAGDLTLEKGAIETRVLAPVSMMPEGLLLSLTHDQIRDLVAYLRHPAQVPLPGEEPAGRQREGL